MPMGSCRCRHISAFTCAAETCPGDPRVEEGTKCAMWMLSSPAGDSGKRSFTSLLFLSGSCISGVQCPLYPHTQKQGRRTRFPRLCRRPTAHASGECTWWLPKHSSGNAGGSEASAVKHHVSEHGSQDGVSVEGRGIRDLLGGFSTNP